MPILRRGSTLRAQWLGQLLRKAREDAEVTTKDAGDYIQRDGSTISRMEAGITPARVADVWALMNLYHVPNRMRPVYEQLSRDIWHKGWWEAYSEEIPDSFIDHAWLESRAAGMRWFDAVSVPGLLQTRAYARASIAANPDYTGPALRMALEYRLNRQKVLTSDSPPRLHAILDEGVLHRRVGGTATMQAQLKRLVEASRTARVELRVIPFDRGAHEGTDGPFVVFNLPDPFPPIAYVQSPGGAIYLEDERAERLAATWDRLAKVALDQDGSTELIKHIITSMT